MIRLEDEPGSVVICAVRRLEILESDQSTGEVRGSMAVICAEPWAQSSFSPACNILMQAVDCAASIRGCIESGMDNRADGCKVWLHGITAGERPIIADVTKLLNGDINKTPTSHERQLTFNI